MFFYVGIISWYFRFGISCHFIFHIKLYSISENRNVTVMYLYVNSMLDLFLDWPESFGKSCIHCFIFCEFKV